MKKFSLFLLIGLAFASFHPEKSFAYGQDGNGDFLYYGEYWQIINVTQQLFNTVKQELSSHISNSSWVFSILPIPVDAKEMANEIEFAGFLPKEYRWRTDPDGNLDLLRMDYSVGSDGEKHIYVLGPMVMALYYLDEDKATALLRKSMILEALHTFGYNEDEGLFSARTIYEMLGYQEIPTVGWWHGGGNGL